MTMFFKVIPFCIGFLLLVSCSMTVQNVESNYALDGNTNRGIVAFSLARTGDAFTIRYWSLDEDSRGEIAATSRSTPADWKDPPTRLIFIELPAGKYEFYEGVDENGPLLERTAPFSIPFEIVAGRVSYLGSIRYDRTLVISRHKLIIDDSSLRDIPLLLEKLPNVSREQVDVSIVSVFDPQ